MTGRVILFGATGFTGRLTAEAMTRAGLAPVLAGRSPESLVSLTGDLAGLGPIDASPTWQSADAEQPDSVRALVHGADDVLVSTVGPFSRYGRAAVDAAVAAGCGYIDSTGEPPFIREVFEDDAVRADATGARLLPAFGYDYVPGNLAGAIAIREARALGRVPVIVEIGYFVDGSFGLSSGTRASVAAVAAAPAFALRNGRVVQASGGVTSFDVDGSRRDAMAVSASEHFCLPRLDPGVRDVDVYLGWAGRWTRGANAAATVLGASTRLPLVGGLVRSGVERATSGSTGEGPSSLQRAGARTVVVARALDGVRRPLSAVRLEGPNPYDLTAELLAWGAAMMHTGRTTASGALGPVDAFGLDALERGCAEMGLHRVD